MTTRGATNSSSERLYLEKALLEKEEAFLWKGSERNPSPNQSSETGAVVAASAAATYDRTTTLFIFPLLHLQVRLRV